MSDDRHEVHWSGDDRDMWSDGVLFRLQPDWHETDYVAVWAGGELDPAFLSPAAARKAADEWPAILRRLADLADGGTPQ